jgi:hypothetical protein
MDEKEARQEGRPATDARQQSLLKTATLVTFTGAAVTALGIALVRRAANAAGTDRVLK